MNTLKLHNKSSKSDLDLLAILTRQMKLGILIIQDKSSIQKVKSILYDGISINLIMSDWLGETDIIKDVLASECGETKQLYLHF